MHTRMHARGISLLSLFGVSLASVYTENTFFPRISKESVASSWQGMYKDMDISKASFDCSTIP